MTTATLLRTYARKGSVPVNLITGLLHGLPATARLHYIDYDHDRPGYAQEVWVRDSGGADFRLSYTRSELHGSVRRIDDLRSDLRACRDDLVTRICDADSDAERKHWERELAGVEQRAADLGVGL